MKPLFSLIIATVGLFSVSSHAEISHSRASELALHRLERLVILNRIDSSFQDKFELQTLEDATSGGEDRFVAKLAQVAGSDGSRKTLVLHMNADGKTLRHEVLDGTEAAEAPVWPSKDPVSLAESALHYVIENGPVKPEVAPFDRAMTSGILRQAKSPADTVLAVYDVTSSETEKFLRIVVDADGNLVSAEVLSL